VAGRAGADGSLTASSSGRVTGRLDGRRISVTRSVRVVPPAGDGLPSLAEALARGRRVAASR
jgi:hypothetical protein